MTESHGSAGDDAVRVHVASINTARATELCIRSAREYASYPFELVIGDGGSTDGSQTLLRALEARGWLTLQVAAEGRSHAEWLDGWLQSCDRRYAAFVDSDIEFLRPGWLGDIITLASQSGAALVCAEMQSGDPHYVHPITGDQARLAPRPSPWLLIVDTEQVRGLDVSFAYTYEEDASAPGGIVSYDVGAGIVRALERSGLSWAEMPQEFGEKYRHYGGLSWKPLRGRLALKQFPKLLSVAWRVNRLRWIQDRSLRGPSTAG